MIAAAWLTDRITTHLGRAIYYSMLWGLDAVELRAVGGPNQRVPNASSSVIRRRLQEAGLSVSALVPGLFEAPALDRAAWLNDLQLLDETCSFCNRVSCPVIVASGFAEPEDGDPAQRSTERAEAVLRQAGERAEQAGVKLAVANEAGYLASSTAKLVELIERADHSGLFAAWRLEVGEDDLFAGHHQRLLARLGHVRISVGAGVSSENPTTTHDDGTWWAGLAELLVSNGYRGAVSLDLAGPDAVRNGLSASTALIRALRDASGGRAR